MRELINLYEDFQLEENYSLEFSPKLKARLKPHFSKNLSFWAPPGKDNLVFIAFRIFFIFHQYLDYSLKPCEKDARIKADNNPGEKSRE